VAAWCQNVAVLGGFLVAVLVAVWWLFGVFVVLKAAAYGGKGYGGGAWIGMRICGFHVHNKYV